MEKLRTKKDECVPQSLEPIEFKVSFPKIHPSDPDKLGIEILRTKIKRITGRVAQWIRRLPTEQEIPGSIPGTFIRIVENVS